MPRRCGGEMRNLVISTTLTVLVVVLAIMAYFMFDILVTTNENIGYNRKVIIDESVASLHMIDQSSLKMPADPELVKEIAGVGFSREKWR
jgi:hypothetical protein